jgi:hypothetical protein
VYYEQGQLDQAIEWQKKACAHGQSDPSIEATLKKYEAEKAAPSQPVAPPKDEAAAAKTSP